MDFKNRKYKIVGVWSDIREQSGMTLEQAMARIEELIKAEFPEIKTQWKAYGHSPDVWYFDIKDPDGGDAWITMAKAWPVYP